MKTFLMDTAERAVATFIEVTVVMLFAPGADLLVNPDWLLAVYAGGVAAAVSVLTSLLSIPVPPLSPWLDLLFRVAKTFIQAFVAVLVVGADYTSADWSGALAAALPVAVLALLKGLASMNVPRTGDGPSLLPESQPELDGETHQEPAIRLVGDDPAPDPSRIGA